MDMAQVRANVQRERLVRGWSKKELAQRAGYATEGMIHQIEQGTRWPSYQQLLALAAAFEVSVSTLVGDAVPGAMTNNANGPHAIGYQRNEGALLMTEELQQVVRAIVREEVDARCRQLETQLVAEFRQVLRDADRDADGAAARAAPPQDAHG